MHIFFLFSFILTLSPAAFAAPACLQSDEQLAFDVPTGDGNTNQVPFSRNFNGKLGRLGHPLKHLNPQQSFNSQPMSILDLAELVLKGQHGNTNHEGGVESENFNLGEEQLRLHPTDLLRSLVEMYDSEPHSFFPEDSEIVDEMRLELAESSRPREIELLEPSSNDGRRMSYWMTEGDKMKLRREGKKFRDITSENEEVTIEGGRVRPMEEPSWPTLSHQSLVRSIIPSISTANLQENLETFSGFWNRYYKSSNGKQSAEWLMGKINDIIDDHPISGYNLSATFFSHSFTQPSIILSILPSKKSVTSTEKPLPPIILGAHQDSANYMLPFLRAPGADDDGSGTVTTLEALRVLVNHLPKEGDDENQARNKEEVWKPKREVQFHWYAAEEGGLLGSKDVVREFVRKGQEVGAMMQFDMTAYLAPGVEPTVTIVTSDVTPKLTQWTIALAAEYADIPSQGKDLMPNAGSDHMSFYQASYFSTFGTEADPISASDPYIHTSQDVIDLKSQGLKGELSFDHAKEFVKVAVGWVVELAGWEGEK